MKNVESLIRRLHDTLPYISYQERLVLRYHLVNIVVLLDKMIEGDERDMKQVSEMA